MTVTVPETYTALAPSSVATDFTLATTLVASDVVILVTARSRTSTLTPTVSAGSIANFVTYSSISTGQATSLWKITGVTGALTITATTGASANARIGYIVLRGLPSSEITLVKSTSTSTQSNTPLSFPVSYLMGREDSIALLMGTWFNVSYAATLVNTLPSSGWTTDFSTFSSQTMLMAHYIPSSVEQVFATEQVANGPFEHAMWFLVVGGPVEDRVYTEYAETLRTGTSDVVLASEYSEAISVAQGDARISSEYVEALTFMIPDRRIYTEYIEALRTGTSGANVYVEYAEALTPPPPRDFIGWGVPIFA